MLWDDLPTFLRDNEYIHSGYRPQFNSYRKCIESLKYIRNQTGNVFTQSMGISILPTVGFDPLHGVELRFPAASQEGVVVFASFIICFIACLSLSFILHTVTNHSPEVQRCWPNLDFRGLLIAASGAFIPGIWYAFYCT